MLELAHWQASDSIIPSNTRHWPSSGHRQANAQPLQTELLRSPLHLRFTLVISRKSSKASAALLLGVVDSVLGTKYAIELRGLRFHSLGRGARSLSTATVEPGSSQQKGQSDSRQVLPT